MKFCVKPLAGDGDIYENVFHQFCDWAYTDVCVTELPWLGGAFAFFAWMVVAFAGVLFFAVYVTIIMYLTEFSGYCFRSSTVQLLRRIEVRNQKSRAKFEKLLEHASDCLRLGLDAKFMSCLI